MRRVKAKKEKLYSKERKEKDEKIPQSMEKQKGDQRKVRNSPQLQS
jgi:hypothetical protein